jgi:hypothetical protein
MNILADKITLDATSGYDNTKVCSIYPTFETLINFLADKNILETTFLAKCQGLQTLCRKSDWCKYHMCCINKLNNVTSICCLGTRMQAKIWKQK